MKNFTRISTNRINKTFSCLLIALLFSMQGLAQNVGINASGNPPNQAAGLDVDFPNMGILIPRVALTGTANSAPLTAHVAGMIVYNTATAGDVVPGFYYDNGTKWVTGFPAGNAVGNMLYWNGTDWVLIPAGLPGQYLQISGSNLPSWGGIIAANPAIVTAAATSITGISATSGANITSDGGNPILSRGICWNNLTGPTIANSKVTDASGGIGTFVSNLTGLSPVTTYYVRGFAINNSTVNYGNEISFTTLAVLPTLAATTAATSITGTTAVSGGNVTATGGSPITERGVCYGTTANPTTANTKIIDPAPGVGTFVSNITGLTGATTYYVRAYAINSIGTAYGTQISFTTLTIPPTLTTVAASNIGYSSATSGGSVTWNGGGYSNYQYYGVCYATVPNSASPTYVNTNSNNYPVTTPIAPWTTTITGLSGNTTYYIRSFLYVYKSGTGPWSYVYGPELTFTTQSITTAVMGPITLTTAVSGGSIAATVPSVAARGVCWNTSPTPTIANSFTSDGASTGTYVSNLTGLTGNTTYYLRAYYTDGANATFYGNEVTFSTGTPRAIGDAMAGGLVVYVDATGQHGLIGALVDQSTSAQWGCYGTTTGATGSAIFTGLANTNIIVPACGAGTAAQLCAAYTAGGTNLPGITNWYLPSKDEFQYLWNQKTLIGLSISCGTYGCYYWTSTEYSSSIAYCIPSNFVSPNYNLYKNSNNYVRAVRAF